MLNKPQALEYTLCSPRCMNVSPPGISLFKAFSPFLISILQRAESCISADENISELFGACYVLVITRFQIRSCKDGNFGTSPDCQNYQTTSAWTCYLFSVSFMMVDALEENVMKDILSIGLEQKRKITIR